MITRRSFLRTAAYASASSLAFSSHAASTESLDQLNQFSLTVQLGVLLGQIEAFAQVGHQIGLIGSEFNYLQKIVPNAQSIASGIKSLPDQRARFARLTAALSTVPSNLESVRAIV